MTMNKPQITTHFADGRPSETRDMNAKELAQYEKDVLESEVQIAEQAAKEATRQTVLTKLGLTADEIAALLS